jgi:hypothetical protein
MNLKVLDDGSNLCVASNLPTPFGELASQAQQIADYDLRTHVAQCLRAFVVISHHRTHRFALLQQLFGERPTPPTRPAAPVTRIGFSILPPVVHLKQKSPSLHVSVAAENDAANYVWGRLTRYDAL